MSNTAKKESEAGSLTAPVAMVLLEERLSLAEVVEEQTLREAIGDDDITLSVKQGADTGLMINWRGVPFAAIMVNSPAPQKEFFASLKMAPDSAVLTEIVRRHQAHLIVSPLTKASHMGDAIDSAIWTMLLAQALSDHGSALGVFWSTSQNLISLETFHDAAHQAVDAKSAHGQGQQGAAASLPMPYWVSLRLFSDEGKFAGRTLGLSAFTGYEAEIAFLDWPAEEVYNRLLNVVNFLFVNGPILQSGQTIGASETEKFSISLEGPDSGASPTLMLRLEGSG